MMVSASILHQKGKQYAHWDRAHAMDSEEKRLLIERFVHAFNSFDMDDMAALLAEDVRFRTIMSGKVTAVANDLEEFSQLALKLGEIYSSRKLTVLECHEKQGKIIAETACTIVEAGRARAAGMTEKVMTFKGFTEFVLRQGKILEITEFYTPVVPEGTK